MTVEGVTLTEGAIERINNEEVNTERDMIPVLRVVDVRLAYSYQSPENPRYTISLSDGTRSHRGMLSKSLNELIRNETLQTGSIVRLTKFTCCETQGMRFVLVMVLEVITTSADIIGGEPNDQLEGHSGLVSASDSDDSDITS